MKILITSGGTKIPIDKVRSITNMSNGTLGAKMATSALYYGHEVIFMKAEKSKSPMQVTIDLAKDGLTAAEQQFRAVKSCWNGSYQRYREHTYKTFDDYQSLLPQLITLYKPDVIILAAAVSDYAPKTVVNGKIRSGNDLNIELQPLPKCISTVRLNAPVAFIIGFKLLVDSTHDDLIAAARHSLKTNDLDLVCANNLNTILEGNHTLYMVNDQEVRECADYQLWINIEHMIKS